MELKDLCKRAYRHYVNGEGSEVIEIDRFIGEKLAEHSGVNSQIVFSETLLSEERLKSSLLLSDFTSIYAKSGVLIGVDAEDLPDWSPRIKRMLGADLLGDFPKVKCMKYLAFWGEKSLRYLEPVFLSGRAMVRPITELSFEDGPATHRVLVEHNSPSDLLLLSEERPHLQNSLPLLDSPTNNQQERDIASLFIPYIENITIRDLVAILDDESEVISEFRLAIKEMIKKAEVDPTQIGDVFNDAVRPSVDRMDRRFRSIVQMHSMRVAGAAISTIALGLVALTNTGIASNISAAMGPAGLGLIAKEVADFLKSSAELREMPLYLLWRLSKANKKIT